jgi:hypothetical protein
MAKHTIVSNPIIDTHDLGSGLVATATYSYAPAPAAPDSGAAWDDSVDLPRVIARLDLPGKKEENDKYPLLVGPLRSSESVLGMELLDTWGSRDNDRRYTQITYHERSLTLSLATARARIAKAVATLRGVVAAREARLAKREATIAAAEEA